MWEQVGRPCCQNPLPWDPSLKTLRVGAQAGKCPLGRRVGPAPRPWRGRCAVTGALVHPKSSPPRAVALGITQPKERSRARPGGPAEDAAFLCQPAVLSGLCGRRVGGALRWEGSWPRTGESEAGRHLLACPRLSGSSRTYSSGLSAAQCTPRLAQCSHGGLEQGSGGLLWLIPWSRDLRRVTGPQLPHLENGRWSNWQNTSSSLLFNLKKKLKRVGKNVLQIEYQAL